jgi:hypothetical protein
MTTPDRRDIGRAAAQPFQTLAQTGAAEMGNDMVELPKFPV